MNVEFVFNGIKNIQSLYKPNFIDSPLGGEEKIPAPEYIGDEYCKNVVQELLTGFSESQGYSYLEGEERFASEAFILKFPASQYLVRITFSTYDSEVARMHICITGYEENANSSEASTSRQKHRFLDNTEYDSLLEQVKISLKNTLKGEWDSCAWIVDEQSETLCSRLYPLVFEVENKIRAFANKVLVHEFGIDWIKQPGLEKYYESHKQRTVDFKRQVPCFADIDDTFIAMTMETMVEIICKAKTYENKIELEDEDYRRIHLQTANNKAESIMELLRNKRKVDTDFWNDLFKQYFPADKDSLKIISDFIKNRNHIAHNKLLNFSGYQIMLQNITVLDKILSDANEKFEEQFPSEELFITWMMQNEAHIHEIAEAEWEKNYLRNRIEDETGIEILSADSIFDKFNETIEDFYSDIDDYYYFNPCYEISNLESIDQTDGEQSLFTITSNADKSSIIEVFVELSISGAMDDESYARFHCRNHMTPPVDLFMAEVCYHNGSGHEDTYEGMIVPDSDSSYDDDELRNLKQQLKEYVDTNLNPLIGKLESMKNEAVRHGGSEPVAEFPCFECDNYGISIFEDFYPLGHCCYCGTDNEIRFCDRCESAYNDSNGSNGLCDSCIDLMNAE